MPRAVSVLLICAVLLLLGLLWRAKRHGNELQARLHETETRFARATAEAATRKAPPPKANDTKAATSAVAPLSSPPETTSEAPSTPRPWSENERGFRKGVDEQRRWTVLAKKADLLTALNLPPEKAAAFKELLVERAYVERDARDAARAAGLQPHEAAAAEVAKIDVRIQGVLGEVDYARYTEQISLAVFRNQLDGSPIPGSLVDAGVPLAPEQMAWMAEMMYRAFGRQQIDRPSSSPDPDADRRAFAAAVLAEAPGKLTPAQIAALRDYFRQDDELAAHMQALIREQSPRK